MTIQHFYFTLSILFFAFGYPTYLLSNDKVETTIGAIDLPSTPLKRGTIFISPNGKGTKCTRKEPCNIFRLDNSQKDIIVKPGDVIFFRGGVYNYSMKSKQIRRIYLQGGTKQAPVIYESYPGELAILDGSLLNIKDEKKKEWREGRLELHGDYIKFRKIEVRNLPQYGIRVFGNHNIVEGCIVHHNHLSGIEILNNKEGYSKKSNGGSFNIIRHNTIFNNSDEGLKFGNYKLGGNADGITIHSGVDNNISNNHIFSNSDDGIDTYKSIHTIVNYNLIYDHGREKGNANGIKLGGSDNILGINAIAKHNIIYANRGFGITVHGKENNITIEYNTAYANKKAGYAILNDTRLNHNIAYQNQKGAFTWSKGKEQIGNSWQKSNLIFKFISFNRYSSSFLKPTSKIQLERIGAYATATH